MKKKGSIVLFKAIKAISKFLPQSMIWKLRPFYRLLLPGITHIIFIPTFFCNYYCPYCLVNRTKYSKKYSRKCEHSWKEWVKQLDKFPPAMINISGGEPFCYPNFIKLIKNIPSKHILAGVATNLSMPLDGILDMSNNILKIATSFHPHMTKEDVFKTKILELKKHGFNLSVNFVAYPEILPLIPKLKDYFEKKIGVKFHVDPYLDPSYQYSKKEAEITKKYISDNRKLGFDFDDYRPKQCRAGSKYFVILPNGDVYACMAGFYYSTELYKKLNISKEEFYLGNLFDDTFKPVTQPRVCSLPCNEACDVESAGVKRYKRGS